MANSKSNHFKTIVTATMGFSNPIYRTSSIQNGIGTPTKQRKRRSRKILGIEMFKQNQDSDSQEFKLPQELAAEGSLGELKAMIEEYSLTLKETDENGGTLLHSATHTNQLQVMQYLIDSGINLDAADDDGNTALHIAVMNGHIEALHLLLNSGASDTILNNEKDAACHIVFRGTNTNLLSAFLEHPFVDLAVQGFRQRTPLHVAAENDNIKIVEAFSNVLTDGSDSTAPERRTLRFNSKDEDNLTPIHLAARKGSHQVLDFMIRGAVKHGYTVDTVLSFLDEENCTPLQAAVDGGHLKVVQVLLKHGSDPTVSKEGQPPPLHIACAQGKIEIVRAMVDCCGDHIIHFSDQYGRSLLHFCASAINGARITAYLIQKGISINSQDKRGRTALHNAITTGSLAVVKELISSGVDTFVKDKNGLNLLHLAVIHNRKAIISLLLSLPNAPQLVNDTNDDKECPVHVALKMGLGELVAPMASVVQYQLRNVADRNGYNYLHLAAKVDDWRALSILLGMTACQTQLNDTIIMCGGTPLHVAAIFGSIRCCEILLSHGAMSHRSYSGQTPFLVACLKGNTECAKILYEAHPYQKDWSDNKGNTALHLAAKSANPSMVKLVLDTGVEVTHNFSHISFLDQIIENMDVKCAMAVVKHSRWQECLDLRSPIRPHPMVGLIIHMPEVAQVVLDRCHTKANLNPENKDYWEKYDFKYLHLTCEDLNDTIIDPNDKPDEIEPPQEYPDEAENPIIWYKGSNNVPAELPVSSNRKSCRSTTVLQKMVHHKRVGLLTHPVVEAFLHHKWKTYGRPFFITVYIMMLLQTLFLTTYIVLLAPTSAALTSTNDTTSNSTILATDLTTHENAIRIAAIIFTILSSFEIFKLGCRILRTRTNRLDFIVTGWFWIQVIAVICSIIFLFPSKPIWEVGALAGFTTWFRVAWGLQYFGIFGIYITMFITITKTALRVLLVASSVLFAFATALYALLAKVPQFSSIGYTLFTTFGYTLGELNYDLFIFETRNETLPYTALTFLFITLLAILLTIVMANLMIGLAVGDIEKVQFNATVEKRAIEVFYFASLDPDIPKRLLKRFNKPYYIKFPNGHNSIIRNTLQYVIQFVYTTSESSNSIASGQDKRVSHTLTAEEHAQELVSLRQQLDGLADMMKQLLEANQQEQIRIAKRNHELPI